MLASVQEVVEVRGEGLARAQVSGSAFDHAPLGVVDTRINCGRFAVECRGSSFRAGGNGSSKRSQGLAGSLPVDHEGSPLNQRLDK